PSAAALGADDHGHGYLAAGHVAHLGHLVDDLVHGHHREVDPHDLHDGSQAGHGRPQAGADEGGFGDGGVPHPLGAKLGQQVLGHAKDAAVMADVFAHEEHPGVSGHLFP